MLSVIDGAAGSGKTWFTTYLTKLKWNRGKNIYVNYQVRFGQDNKGITRWHNLEETTHLTDGVLVIDDGLLLLDAHRWYNLPQAFREKIAAHRHDHLEIITNIQHFSDIDPTIRRNVHVRYRCYSIFRWPLDEDIKPILQMITIRKKTRKVTDRDIIQWQNKGGMKFFFLSRFWNKEYYGTYDNIYLKPYICKLICDSRKPKNQKWILKIYSREMVNQGKARI